MVNPGKSGPQYRLLIFDFDGTLVDTAPDIAYHVNAVLRLHGLPEQPLARVKKAIGRGMHELLRDLGFDKDAAALDAAVAELKKRYTESPVIETAPYPGVKEMLAGPLGPIKKAIATNKPQLLTEKILRQLSLERHFELVVGDGSNFPRKPDPASVRHILKTLGVEAAEAFFIGDSCVDHQTAVNAGVDFAWMTYGYDESLFRYENLRRFSGAIEWKSIINGSLIVP